MRGCGAAAGEKGDSRLEESTLKDSTFSAQKQSLNWSK
jgi:hypothetical protein